MVITPEVISLLLPYRPPMLLVDRVLHWESQSNIMVEKRVDGEDPTILNHLIGGPRLMPGAMMIEMVGQAALLLEQLSKYDASPNLISPSPPVGPILFKVLARCKAKFIRPVYAGDTLIADVHRIGAAVGGTLHSGRLLVRQDLVAEVEVMALDFVHRSGES